MSRIGLIGLYGARHLFPLPNVNNCLEGIDGNIIADCADMPFAGLEANVRLINRNDIDYAATYGRTAYIATYRGVDIYRVVNWDETIRTYFDNGTKWNLPHRALLTTPDNIPIGTPSTEMLGSLDSFYDRKDKKNYVDAEIMVDIQLLEDYMAVAAY